jgi:hypothetical protein
MVPRGTSIVVLKAVSLQNSQASITLAKVRIGWETGWMDARAFAP